ncbi:MAG: maleylpyruvate isomerase family mycothiol-dependent enzyme [Actinobacteria bacterium]|nr:maleylpyruvate isomerase family mycothiol-dependent enzyme [Actinomycetota bacterium]
MTVTTTLRARELPQTASRTARTNLAAEYEALLTQVDGMGADDWRRPTDCTGWTVRDMVAHLAGAAECSASKAGMARHYGYAWRTSIGTSATFVDQLCASQIRSRTQLSVGQVAEDLRRWAREAPAKVEGWPRLLRRLRLPAWTGLARGATLGYFLDVITIRDVWMHRVDLSRALGAPRDVTEAEAETVSQVTRDLDAAWAGAAVDLTLTGRGGGTWRVGAGEPVAHVTEDAVAYLRLLSGRSDECVLRCEGDQSVADALRAARVAF